MHRTYQIITDATADMVPEMLVGLPEVQVIPMGVTLGEKAYTYGPGGDITVEEFYAAQRDGKFATTSQINPTVYLEYFEACLQKGEDVLYLCLTSGVSGTFQTASLCAAELQEKYPEGKVICIDSLCASVGEGFLVREAARKQKEGLTLDELVQWVNDHRQKVCHWFTVDTFEHLKHGGRVSGAAAMMGTLLQIKPMLHVSMEGKLDVAEKPRGAKRALAAQLARMKKGWTPKEGKLIVVGHGDCIDRAQELAEQVKTLYPDTEIYIAPIGPIIGSHTGPGMLALIFWGTER